MGTLTKKALFFNSGAGGGSFARALVNTHLDKANTDTFTWIIWAKLLTNGLQAFMSKRLSQAGTGPEFRYDTSQLRVILNGTGADAVDVQAGTSGEFSDKLYHMYAFSWDGAAGNNEANLVITADAQVVGTRVVNQNDLASTIANPGFFQISGVANQNRNILNGFVDFACMYDRVLSLSELDLLFAGGDPADPRLVLPSGLTDFFPFDADVIDISGVDHVKNFVSIAGATSYAATMDHGRESADLGHVDISATDLPLDGPGGISTRSLLGSTTERMLDDVSTNFDMTIGLPRSLTYWFKHSSSSSVWVSKVSPSPELKGARWQSTSGGQILFTLTSDNSAAERIRVTSGANTYVDDTWTYVATTYDGSATEAGMTMRVGRPPATSTVDVTTPNGDTWPGGGTLTNSALWQISGQDGATATIRGNITDVRHYPRVLSVAEIDDEYNEGVPKFMDILAEGPDAGWWRPGQDFQHLELVNAVPTDVLEFAVGEDGGGGSVSSAPVIDNFDPPVGTPLNRNDIVSFDVTDDTGLLRAEISVVLGDDVFVVHDGDSFRGRFSNFSNRAAITDGFRYSVRPNGGWRDAPTFEVHAVDTSGQEAT